MNSCWISGGWPVDCARCWCQSTRWAYVQVSHVWHTVMIHYAVITHYAVLTHVRRGIWHICTSPGCPTRAHRHSWEVGDWLKNSEGQLRGDWIPQTGCFFGKLPNGLWPPPPLPIFGNYIALFFAKICKYALTCVNLQWHFFQNLRPKYTVLKPKKSAM